MVRIRRLIVRLDAEAARRLPPIGHNGGPPLDVSWSGWLWRKAVARAWKTPRREVALRRLRRAEQLGLTYRELTGVLMDRGAWLGAIVFAPGALTRVKPARVHERFAMLENCRVLVCVDACDANGSGESQVLADPRVSDKVAAVQAVRCADCRRQCNAPRLVQAIREFCSERHIAPGEVFMVGSGARDLGAAEDASLALFKPAERYFAPA